MTNKSRLQVGVIGVGALGRHHARLYAQNPQAEVVGIFDVQKAAAEKVGAEFGLPVFADWRALAEKCQALSVAVPATLHGQTVLPLLEMGRHVLVEKPLAATLEEAEKMVETARARNLVLGVGHVERFNPATDFLMRQSGEIRYISARRQAPYPPPRVGLPPRGTEVSVILDLMIHDLDLILALMRSEVANVEVFGSALASPSADFAAARIEFIDGRCADVTASRLASTPLRQLQVVQDERFWELNYAAPEGALTEIVSGSPQTRQLEFPARNALADELDDFLTAVRVTEATGRLTSPRIPGIDGLQALKLALAIEYAAETRNAQEHER